MPLLLEKFLDNPFLPLFYQNPDRYAFSTETAFLAERYRQMHEEMEALDWKTHGLVADYTFYKSLVFASKTLPPQEAILFRDLFGIVNRQLPQPQLLVYLSSPSARLMSNIRYRGRDFEQSITPEYLAGVESSYRDFLAQAGGLRCLWVHWEEGVDLQADEGLYQRFRDFLGGDFRYGLTSVNLADL
jgi:deoxyadenosine/deoxycytidine kinase